MNTFNYKSWELNLNFSYNFGAYVKTTPSYRQNLMRAAIPIGIFWIDGLLKTKMENSPPY